MNTITRAEYAASKSTHREYYAQFVIKEIKEDVINSFGIKKLQKAFSEDQYFNTIPLQQWDMLVRYMFGAYPTVSSKIRKCGDFPTLAGGVCILKEAARQLVEA